jgi:uncharacterized protein YndB with AHSA1/START domain
MSFQRSYAIPAKPAPVFDALTSELHLRTWFTEQLEVGDAPGDPFPFWGKRTLWVPETSDATQTLTRLDFPSALAFSWTWRGVPTEVKIEIAADGEGSRLALSHSFERPWPASDPDLGEVRAARQDRIVEDFWDVAMANLAYYLFEGEPLLLPDFAAVGEQLELSLLFEAPAEEVFAALTEPKQLEAWIAEEATVELEEGGAYRYGWTAEDGTPLGPAKLLDVRSEERLLHDWAWPGEPETRVRWDLVPEGHATRVSLAHEGFEAASPVYALAWCRGLLALRARLSDE